jgi:DNA-binding MarR family transcriptional regulator
MRQATTQRLEADKRATTFQVLIKVARLVNERSIARVNERAGRTIFRQALANLFPHIPLEGTRITELAHKLQVSKQAVSKLVGELEAEGILETVPDPQDGRARLVRFTPRGIEAIHEGMKAFRDVESQLARKVGRKRLERLGDDLRVLLDALEGQ